MMSDPMTTPDDVLRFFWFEELDEEDWFKSSPELDAECARGLQPPIWRSRAGSIRAGSRSAVLAWRRASLRSTARNIYRGSPLAFATDGLARREARLALDVAADQAVGRTERASSIFPSNMRRRSRTRPCRSGCLPRSAMRNLLDYAERHAVIVSPVRPFPAPQRNLGRETTLRNGSSCRSRARVFDARPIFAIPLMERLSGRVRPDC